MWNRDNTYDLNTQYREMFEAHYETCKKLDKENQELRARIKKLEEELSKVKQ